MVFASDYYADSSDESRELSLRTSVLGFPRASIEATLFLNHESRVFDKNQAEVDLPRP